NGKIHGRMTQYHRRGGQPETVEEYVNGVRHGLSTTYSPRGNVILKVQFENGRRVRTVEDNRK
ncbi:MAG TPA: hypothetical protein VKY29_01340, partial [Cryomorphaceae bacterium]|nr:hypothetical protein [Cryomorphaceae bacterium]